MGPRVAALPARIFCSSQRRPRLPPDRTCEQTIAQTNRRINKFAYEQMVVLHTDTRGNQLFNAQTLSGHHPISTNNCAGQAFVRASNCAHKCSYGQTFVLANKHANTYLCKQAFACANNCTSNRLYEQTPVRTQNCTNKRLDEQTLLQTNIFTNKHEQTLARTHVHTHTHTHKHIYIYKYVLMRTDNCMRKHCYQQEVLCLGLRTETGTCKPGK